MVVTSTGPRHFEAGNGRRADVLNGFIAGRTGMMVNESDIREELSKDFVTYTRDVLRLEDRAATQLVAGEAQRAKEARRLGQLATLRLPPAADEERARRAALLIGEERRRAGLRRVAYYEWSAVNTREKVAQLIRAEDTKRYCMGKHELAGFAQLVFESSQSKNKPTIKMLGHCPFARKADCPFASRYKLCHGMPLAAEHYTHSVVEQLEPGML
jgi:hypothetical protein